MHWLCKHLEGTCFFSNLQLILNILSDALQVSPGYLPVVPSPMIKLDIQARGIF